MSKEHAQALEVLSHEEKVQELERIHERQIERESTERWERWTRERQEGANRDRALFALLGARSVMEAARNSGISRATFYNYMKDLDFRTAFNDLRKEQRDQLEDDFFDLSHIAVNVIRELLETSIKEKKGNGKLDSVYAAKLNASFRILDYVNKPAVKEPPETAGSEITARAKIPENTNAIAGAFIAVEKKRHKKLSKSV